MKKTNSKKVKYYLNNQNEFVIENYNHSKPFANFFPGIAGKYGIPMWVFYVNRAQGIASFGIKDKDHSILEFQPANKAWQMASTHGFRTFTKVKTKGKTHFYEPFRNGLSNAGFSLTNKMHLDSNGLSIEEENPELGLSIKVEYYNIPNESFAGLARILTVKNLGSSTKKIQLLDGLPQIIPFGTSNLFLKKLSRTIEAWMQVKNLENKVPFYKLDVDPVDRPEILHIKEGNFYLGFTKNTKSKEIIKPIVDPENVFGQGADFCSPNKFFFADKFSAPLNESITSRTPCGFFLLDWELKPKEEKTFFEVIGYARSIEELNQKIIKKITSEGYLTSKKEESRKIINDLQNDIDTKSSSPNFDLYAKQTYLDNILRGGYPVIFKTSNGAQHETSAVFYLYSRKHGDLERDYNKFLLEPTYFSQGNGNYRDANQNRRSDTWFNPEIKDENLVYFLNLIQTDGFNPLVVKGVSFILKDKESFKAATENIFNQKDIPQLINFLSEEFTPGKFIHFLEEAGIKTKVSHDELLNTVLGNCEKQLEAEHGEGFWTDHWTYNLDLIESYLGVFPEKLKELLFQKRDFSFYDNYEVVRPRSQKHLLYNGRPRQLHSVVADNAKKETINKRSIHPHMVRADYGKGEIYQTTLINKLLCLVSNKLSSLDPNGVGIEMEANKPNWYDALNGLPALFGSSPSETMELKRLIIFIRNSLLNSTVDKLSLTEEIHDLLLNLNKLLEENISSSQEEKDFIYWNKSCALKEEYRLKTRYGLSGKETEIACSALLKILELALKKIDAGLDKAYNKKTGIYYSYFMNLAEDYETLDGDYIKVKKFKQTPLPYFLEGQMHALRINQDAQIAKKLYLATKKSELFDRKLKMYKVTAPLKNMPEEIGRCRVFTPGWLENESIWLHMEYKYLLETFKQGLYEEFYEDLKNVLICFQKPAQYGRSVLENSSFLVSSAFPDKNLHGNGFVARLSGSTAEFLQLWLLMNAGLKPFFLNESAKLNLHFQPVIAGWLFDKKGLYSFNFLSKVRVTYYNPKKKNTFGKNAALIKRISFSDASGKEINLSNSTIPAPYAEQVRSRLISKIDIYLE